MKSDLDAIYKSGLDAIYKFSLLSRLFTVGLCLVTGYLTLDYDVSSTLEFDVSSTLEFNISTAEAIAPALKAFVRWDAVYFVDIAENGYSREQQFAFFPGYPLLVYLLSCLSSFLPWSFLPAIPSTTRIVISGKIAKLAYSYRNRCANFKYRIYFGIWITVQTCSKSGLSSTNGQNSRYSLLHLASIDIHVFYIH